DRRGDSVSAGARGLSAAASARAQQSRRRLCAAGRDPRDGGAVSRLDGLIRLHRWQLDEHRRRTVELEALRQTTIERIQALDEAVAKVAAAVGSDLASQAAYRAYAARARAQQAKLAETLDTLETEIAE